MLLIDLFYNAQWILLYGVFISSFDRIVNDLPSDVEPHIETECDHNDHTSGEPDMDNSFSEEVRS